MKVIGIFAHTINGIFGVDGNLPWPNKIKEDMAFFRETTMGSPIIMGRGTWLSLGCKPLPGRLNVVISSFYGKMGRTIEEENVRYFSNFEDAYDYLDANDYAKCFVIGGATLFDRIFNLIDEWYVTVVDYCSLNDDAVITKYNNEWMTLRPGMRKIGEKFVPLSGNVDNIPWLLIEHYAYDIERDWTHKKSIMDHIRDFFE